MPEDSSETAGKDPDRLEALIAQVLNERTFVRITRPQELTEFRTKLISVIQDLVPERHHPRLQELITEGLDRVLDALVGDARGLEAQAMWTRRTELKTLQLEHELLETKIRLRNLEVTAAGTGDAASDSELVDLMTRLVDVSRRLEAASRAA